MASSKIILTCGHCGNTTAFTVAAEGFRPNTINANDAETTTWTTWRVLLCSTCSQPTLERDESRIPGGPNGRRPPRGPSQICCIRCQSGFRCRCPPRLEKCTKGGLDPFPYRTRTGEQR